MSFLGDIADMIGIGTTGVPWGTVGSFATGLLSSAGQANTNQTNIDIAGQNNTFNAQQAQENRDWQSGQVIQQMDFQRERADAAMNYDTYMSNTAYQRATADMEAAGLNPMLAYSQGGASTPSAPSPTGSVGSSSAATAAANPQISNPFNAGLNAAAQAASIDRTSADTENVKADTDLKRTQIPLTEAKKEEILQLLPSRIRNVMADTNLKDWQAIKDKTQAEINRYDFTYIKPEEAAKLRTAVKLLDLDVPKALAESKFWKSGAGQLAPYVEHSPTNPLRTIQGLIGKGANSASTVDRALNLGEYYGQ